MFHRSKVKLSYILNIIKSHKTRLLQEERFGEAKTKPYNCSNRSNCPLDGQCQIEAVIYSAEVSDGNHFNTTYIGFTADSFKGFYNHNVSFRFKSHRNDCKQANSVWGLKKINGRVPHIMWNIIKKVKLSKDCEFLQTMPKRKIEYLYIPKQGRTDKWKIGGTIQMLYLK